MKTIGSMDSLGDRMKEYESVFSHKLMRRMFTVIRIDGKAFHTYTKGLQKPFDRGLVEDMIETTKYLCGVVQNCKLGYVQSDEISLILTDFDTITTQAWFNNELQKMVSISASLATSKFNDLRTERQIMKLGKTVLKIDDDYHYPVSEILKHVRKQKSANFDSRVYQLPNFVEVGNYLRWRQQDAVRNSISGAAQSVYSHRELNGKDSNEKQEMIFRKGNLFKERIRNCGYIPNVDYPDKANFNWNDIPDYLKRGSTVTKELHPKHFTEEVFNKDRRSFEDKVNSDWYLGQGENGEYTYLKKVEAWTPNGTDYRESTDSLIPIFNLG